MSSSNDGENTRSDAELLADYVNGDARAFDLLYHRHRDFAARLARRFVDSDADAQDVLQDAFFYLIEHSRKLALTVRLSTYLYPIIRNIALAGKRRKSPDKIDPVTLDTLRSAMDDEIETGDLHKILSTLSESLREPLLMRFVDDLSLEEIAQALQIPLGTVKSRIHNALNQLRQSPTAKKYFLEDL
jgi:RNA polymerase sigma-70 factor, ECF subfamily